MTAFLSSALTGGRAAALLFSSAATWDSLFEDVAYAPDGIDYVEAYSGPNLHAPQFKISRAQLGGTGARPALHSSNITSVGLVSALQLSAETTSTASATGQGTAKMLAETIVDIAATLAAQIETLDRQGNWKGAVRLALGAIESEFAGRRFEQVEALLSAINAASLSPRTAIAVVRSTYRARTRLPAWKSFYHSSRGSLEEKGHNVASLFFGIEG